MLQYQKVDIYVCATFKISEEWPNLDLNRRWNSFEIIPHCSNISEFETTTTHPNNNRNNSLKISPNSNVNPRITYKGKEYAAEPLLILKTDGIGLFKLKFIISETEGVKYVNAFINDLLNAQSRLICLAENNYTLITYAELIIKKIASEMFQPNVEIRFYETYSVINPHAFSEQIGPASLVGSAHEIEIYEAAIRRMPDMSNSNIEIARNVQKNISTYKHDLVYVNYHNLLVYVDIQETPKHIPPSVYIEMFDHVKVYVAHLLHIKDELNKKMRNLNKTPCSLKELQDLSDWMDLIRFKYIKTDEEFDSLTASSSVRIRWALEEATKKFSVNRITATIQHDLDEIEKLISRKLSFLQQKEIEKAGNLLAVLSCIISIVGIIISLH